MAKHIHTGNASCASSVREWTKRGLFLLAAPLAAVMLSACGGGGAAGGPSSTPTTPLTATLTLTLTDPTTNAAVSVVSPGRPAKVSATFRTSANVPVPGAVVTFRTDDTLGTFSPANAAAVTDAQGVASVTLFPSTVSGAGQVTATTQTLLSGGTAPVTVTGTTAFTATAAPAITLGLFDPGTGAARTSITAGSPARASATLRQNTGAPASGVVVTFTTDPLLGTFNPSTGTALTDSAGVASVILNASTVTSSGAGIVTAAAQIGTNAAAAPVTQSIGYSLGTASLAVTPVSIAAPTLSAFGTTSASVTVTVGGAPTNTPFTVNFTSPCARSGRAALTASVATVNGVATASYRDIGCAGADVITASVSGLAISSTGTVSVAAPAVGSIQYVSATPMIISLRGTGGLGRQETSQVSFRVVDVGGNPLGGRTVVFSLNTTVGGITLSSTTATSDPTSGLVVTNVQSGTISTPVRVTATTVAASQTLTTQSDQLTITTGIPAQDGFSLSVSTINIEGFNFDGTTTQLTVRLADHFRNPVPDGTAVNFTAEGASVVGSCLTAAGACTVTFTSQNFRPTNGRITTLAYAVGEEGFTDLNGNGWFDLTPATELIDAGGTSTDLTEAFVDFNENGVRDANEPFIDFNNNGVYDLPDGKFSGVLCDDTIAGRSAPGSCAAAKTLNVRGSLVVVLSTSTASFARALARGELADINIPVCTTGTRYTYPQVTRDVVITDLNGNAMPAGTTVAFSTTNGVIRSATSYTVGNTSACSRPGIAANCPASNADLEGIGGFGFFRVVLESDVTQTGPTGTPAFECTNRANSGSLTATVTTPRGISTLVSIVVND